MRQIIEDLLDQHLDAYVEAETAKLQKAGLSPEDLAHKGERNAGFLEKLRDWL